MILGESIEMRQVGNSIAIHKALLQSGAQLIYFSGNILVLHLPARRGSDIVPLVQLLVARLIF
jgi:hypothetical protein